MMKKLQNYSTGQAVTSGEVPVIAIVTAGDVISSKRLLDAAVLGARAAGACVTTLNTQKLGYANKINPMSAKFAQNFVTLSSATAQAIIKTNMVDGIVLITDCDITACGFLHGAHEVNCPILVMPTGTVHANDALEIAGKIASAKHTTDQGETLMRLANQVHGAHDNFNSVSTFFMLAEFLGFAVENSSLYARESGALISAAQATGEKIVSLAKDILAPKKLLTKQSFIDCVTLVSKVGGDVGALKLIEPLFVANDIKIPHEMVSEIASKTPLLIPTGAQNGTFVRENGGVRAFFEATSDPSHDGEITSKTARIVLATGSACDSGGYIQFNEFTPMTFSGKAWVYPTLEDADRALLGGNIPANSVIVLHDCVGANVTALAKSIEGMSRATEIAIATDGFCDKTSVLAVTCCTPNSMENEEFANIQNGDVLDIDVSRGRFNTSILAKDLKSRAKKNTSKKPVVHF